MNFSPRDTQNIREDLKRATGGDAQESLWKIPAGSSRELVQGSAGDPCLLLRSGPHLPPPNKKFPFHKQEATLADSAAVGG